MGGELKICPMRRIKLVGERAESSAASATQVEVMTEHVRTRRDMDLANFMLNGMGRCVLVSFLFVCSYQSVL